MNRWQLLLPLVAIAWPGSAWALKPAKHRELAQAACAAERLPDAFCRRMGKAVYETDYREWTDLATHAQTPRGGDRCTAADAAAARLDALGRDIVAEVARGDAETAAIDLGRALHTLQDECAHHGMTNEEHAFYSLTQTCTGDAVSPDIQPEAIACADDRTRRAMHDTALALAGTSWPGLDALCADSENRDTCQAAATPTPLQACDFLALYKDWSGTDSTWNGDVVGAALEAAFAGALRGDPLTRTACGGDPHAIDPASPRPPVINHDLSCAFTSVSCLGKVDDGGDDPYGAPPTTGGGCSVGGGAGLVAALAAIVLRRRRAAR